MEWLKQLHPEHDPLNSSLLASLGKTEESSRQEVLQNANRFDVKHWKALSHELGARMRRIPVDGDAARCLAFERLEDAKELHRRAMRTESPKPWHSLRIGVKHFRYSVESLIPTLHVEWAESLKRVQDVLGNIHDLDVLAAMLHEARADQPGQTGSEWTERIERERHQNLETYRQLALGKTSIWQTWQSGFPREHRQRYANARIAATRKSLDAKPARSQCVARISTRLWSELRASNGDKMFFDGKEKSILDAAARLSGIRTLDRKKPREKSARTFLLKSPLPPGWNFAEWERVAWAIRFQRAAEPGLRNKRFSKLSAEQQGKICLHAGILRMAVALQKSGVHAGAALHIENLPQGLLLHVLGVEDNPENAVRFVQAKRLLERSLGKTILIQAEPDALMPAERKQKLALPQAISIVQ